MQSCHQINLYSCLEKVSLGANKKLLSSTYKVLHAVLEKVLYLALIQEHLPFATHNVQLAQSLFPVVQYGSSTQ